MPPLGCLLLTNFQVLDFLRNKSNSAIEDEKLAQTTIAKSEDAEDDQSDRIKQNLTLSEMNVYEYLVQTAARDQTRECVNEFLQRCKKHEFAEADIVSILNIRPSTPSATVELYSIVESFFERFEDQVDEIVQMIEDVLPPRPVTKKGGYKERWRRGGRASPFGNKQSNEFQCFNKTSERHPSSRTHYRRLNAF
ncbi:hypothetical protein QQ045_018321 [Rhodiola kirilowii]